MYMKLCPEARYIHTETSLHFAHLIEAQAQCTGLVWGADQGGEQRQQRAREWQKHTFESKKARKNQKPQRINWRNMVLFSMGCVDCGLRCFEINLDIYHYNQTGLYGHKH